MLALVACSLVLALTYPVREYFAQRSQLHRLEKQTAQQRARVGDLQKQLDRWNDPAYVKAQARRRLHYVMPGETGLVTVGEDPAHRGGTPGGGGTQAPGAGQSWFSDLANSVKGAGTPEPRE